MKNLKSILFVAAAAMTLASCGVKEITPEVKPEGRIVYFGTEVNDLTKASLTTEDDVNFVANWENNDALEVAGFDRGSHIASFPAVWDSEKDAFAASGDVKYFFDEPYDFIGVYPQPEEGVIDFGSARTQDGNNYAGKYDVMLSEATSLTLVEGETFVLPMDRQTAIAYFHLTSTLSEDEKIVSATLSVNENLAGSFIYDKGEIAPEATANSITLSFTNAPSIKDLRLWFNIFPGEYTGLKLEVETEKHTLTIQNLNKVTYEQGKLYKVAADATAKYKEKEDPDGDRFVKVAADCDDWSGTYLIVYKDSDDNLTAFNSGLETLDASNNGESVTADSNGDIYLDENTAKYVVTVAPMTGGYSIKASNGKYICGTSGSNKLNANNTASVNTFTWVPAKNYLQVTAPTYLTFNTTNSDNRFRYMKNDNQNTAFYRLNGKYNPNFPVLTVVDQEVAGSYLNVTIPVTSNRDWTAEITSGAKFVDGGALTTASGSGNGNITFKFAAANTSYFETQEVTLRVTAETKVADITVTHKAKTGVNLQINGETSNITDNVDADVTQYVANITANFPEWTVLAYSIDGVDQVTSGENCVRTYDAEAGTGTVTLKFPSNEATTEATAAKSIVLTVGYEEFISRTITIIQAGDEPEGGVTNGWVKTDIGNITAEDVFVIVMGSSALPNDKTDVSPLAVGVTILGSTITSEVADNLKWKMTGNAKDGYTFLSYVNAQNALFSNTTASSKSNTSVRVGAPTSGTNRKVFEFATSGDKTTLKTKDSYTARYITLYSDAGTAKDWRAYTTMSNVAGSIELYVHQDNRESQSLYFSAEAGTIDLNGNVRNLPSLDATGAVTTITYTSSVPAVATVDENSGVITALAVGETVITATAAADATHKAASASFTLTVSDSTPKTDLSDPAGLTWTESTKTLSWTDPNTGKGTYNINYKYQYSVNGGSSWSDANTSTSATLSISSTTTVKVKAVAITTGTHNSSDEVETSCTITPKEPQTATFTMKNSNQSSPVTVNSVTFTWTSSNIVVGKNNTSGFKANSNMTVTIPAGAKLTKISKGNGNTWGSGAQIDVYAGTSSSGTKLTTITKDTHEYTISSNNTGTTYYFANTSSKNAWINTLTIEYQY